MKRFSWLLLLTALCLGLLAGLCCAASAEETKPTCAECGGEPKFTTYKWVNDERHTRACIHGVIDPNYPLIRHSAFCDGTPGVCNICNGPYSGPVMHHQGESYVSDDTHHWYVCLSCEQIFDEAEHYAQCDNPGVCAACGHAYSGDAVQHNMGDDWFSDETSHWRQCTGCGIPMEKSAHYAVCTAPNECAVCGAAYSGDDVIHREGDWESDETQHWTKCLDCGEEISRYDHQSYCDAPGVCIMCGRAYSGGLIFHHPSGEYQHDDMEHWQICQTCNQRTNVGAHHSVCTNRGVCRICGLEGSFEVYHFGSEDQQYQFNDTEHWLNCIVCGEEIIRTEHAALCDVPGVCSVCGCEYTGDNVTHHWGDWEFDNAEHWQHCTLCGDEFERGPHEPNYKGVCYCGYEGQDEEPHEHVWTVASEKAATCQEAGSITYVCSGCGEQYSEPLEKLEHDWQFASHTDPTCTSQGEDRYTCTLCGYYYTDKIPMLAHEFGAFESQRDGDHAAVCAVCGTENREPCVYDENGVCTVCGYVKPTVEPTVVAEVVKTVQETVAQAQTSDVPEELLAQIVVTTETLEDDTTLVVSDQSALLPEDSGVLCLFNVEVTENDQPIAVTGAVRVKIPWTQGPDVTLYRLTDDGKLVEIPFEYDAENNLLLFETDTLGSFVILPKA